MEDFKEFEETQAELEEYFSNGIINEENTCQDSLEMASEYSYGIDQMSEYNSNSSRR